MNQARSFRIFPSERAIGDSKHILVSQQHDFVILEGTAIQQRWVIRKRRQDHLLVLIDVNAALFLRHGLELNADIAFFSSSEQTTLVGHGEGGSIAATPLDHHNRTVKRHTATTTTHTHTLTGEFLLAHAWDGRSIAGGYTAFTRARLHGSTATFELNRRERHRLNQRNLAR